MLPEATLPRRLLFSIVVSAFVVLPAREGLAAECDLPLVVQQTAVTPNVLVILDTSGSMNEPIYHADYDPDKVYPGTFATTKYYYVSSAGLYAPRDFNYAWPTSPKAPLIEGHAGQRGYLQGNYANWVFYHATDEQRATLPQTNRMEVGIEAVRSVVLSASGLRYGLMTFNAEDGGILDAPVGSSLAEFRDAVQSAVPKGYTPTAETLYDAAKYFGNANGDSPIQESCQQNFIVLVTDGIPTKDRAIPDWLGDQDGDGREPGECSTIYPMFPDSYECSDFMDDVAYYMANNDLHEDFDGDQTVTTYAIGFALDHYLIQDTANNGNGIYRSAWDLAGLTTALGTVIGDIVNRVSAGAAVAVVSTEAGTSDHLYRGKFMPGEWTGFLEAYSIPYHAGDRALWEAGELLRQRTPDSRTIFTSIDGVSIDFAANNGDELAPWMEVEANIAPYVIDYVRGKDFPTTRARDGWKLGDLVYSTPVVVGPPSQFVLEADYQSFLQAHANRKPVLYIGSNDGMLHAFRADNGQEIWGYVPQGVLHNLSDLASTNYCHTSYVDLSPVAFDVRHHGTWKTVLFGGLRTGGNTYFALDITNPFSPKFLWETPMPSLTASFTQPAIVRTEAYGTLVWVGSGPSSTGQAWLGAMRVDDGNPLFQMPMGGPIGGLNMLGAATGFDSDYDGFVDVIYQGDLAGNLWRFWVHDPNGAWNYSKMFEGTEPIQSKPMVALNEDNEIFVYFGTGKYLEGSDVSDTQRQRFYAVKDDGSYATVYASSLVDQTSSINEVSGGPGWYFDLVQRAGERITEAATIVEGVVYVTSFAPSDEPCEAGGTSWLYRIDYRDGQAIDEDTQEPTDDLSQRAKNLGDGIASRPVVSLGSEEVVVQTSDAQLTIEELAISPQTIMVRAWRERFMDNTGTMETERQ